MQAKRNAETSTVSFSALRLHGMKLLNNWILLREKIRILQMKLRIFLINLEMEDDLFMSLTNNADDLRLRKKSFRLP
jgi:hypothetical protein